MTNGQRGWGSAFGPSEEYAAGRAASEASTAFDTAGGAEARRMTSMGINPNSGRFAGLRSKWALRKAAGVSGAATRAAGTAREASFERLLRMISAGRGGAFMPQQQAVNAGFGGSTTVGPADATGEGGDYNARVQRHLAQLRGEAVPGAEGGNGIRRIGEGALGVRGIGESGPRIRGIGEGAARPTGALKAYKEAYPDAGLYRAGVPNAPPRISAFAEPGLSGPLFGSGAVGMSERPDVELNLPAFATVGNQRSAASDFDIVWGD
jgi:hypothetical protein